LKKEKEREKRSVELFQNSKFSKVKMKIHRKEPSYFKKNERNVIIHNPKDKQVTEWSITNVTKKVEKQTKKKENHFLLLDEDEEEGGGTRPGD
jgi:hypothetical protein